MDYSRVRDEIQGREKELQQRLAELEEQRKLIYREEERISKELGGLQKMEEGLSAAVNTENNVPKAGITLTDFVRVMLRATPDPLTPAEIRDICLQAGIGASSPRMLLITVHNTIRRMRSELRRVRLDGNFGYMSKPSSRRERLGQSH